MSKDIWHIGEETPEEDRVIVVKSKRTGKCLVGNEFELILDNFTKWAYFDDLLALETELIRTRKALDVAVDKLKGIKAYYDDSYADPHTFVNWHIVAQRLANDADDAIKAITALEQKD